MLDCPYLSTCHFAWQVWKAFSNTGRYSARRQWDSTENNESLLLLQSNSHSLTSQIVKEIKDSAYRGQSLKISVDESCILYYVSFGWLRFISCNHVPKILVQGFSNQRTAFYNNILFIQKIAFWVLSISGKLSFWKFIIQGSQSNLFKMRLNDTMHCQLQKFLHWLPYVKQKGFDYRMSNRKKEKIVIILGKEDLRPKFRICCGKEDKNETWIKGLADDRYSSLIDTSLPSIVALRPRLLEFVFSA